MGAKLPLVVSNTIVNTVVVGVTETVVGISPPFSPPLDGGIIIVLCSATVLLGATQTGLIVRLRRGTTTAGLSLPVQPFAINGSAGGNYGACAWYFDLPPSVAGQQYCVTAQQFGGGANNGTCSDVAILAFAL